MILFEHVFSCEQIYEQIYDGVAQVLPGMLFRWIFPFFIRTSRRIITEVRKLIQGKKEMNEAELVGFAIGWLIFAILLLIKGYKSPQSSKTEILGGWILLVLWTVVFVGVPVGLSLSNRHSK